MIQILSQMGWPAGAAIIGLAWAIAFMVGVPIIFRVKACNRERELELHLKRAIQLESFKKGSLTYIEENN